jgi:DNA-binding transcriptional regulator/RsmH inhibitor MraZ
VDVTHLFSGNALGAVDGQGRVRLPVFILREMERSGECSRLIFGVHEKDPCLTGYGPKLKLRLHGELERRRLRDEEAGRPADDHHARARRTFGLVEEASWDEGGTVRLPPLARRRGRIGERILFIGAGTSFEMWDPAVALAEGDEEVREVAQYRLGRAGEIEEETGR